ncbi:MAG: transposase [Planctomycetota bacterium]
MPYYRRNLVPGGTYFFTVVTAKRKPIFNQSEAVELLRQVIRIEKQARPFEIIASVILPDHLHMIWTLPSDDADYSKRWQSIKASFTRTYLRTQQAEQAVTPGYREQRRRGVWQPRFLEHTIRDEKDLADHTDYIHFNPVKHGYVSRPADWPYSSLHSFIERGWLDEQWGCGFGLSPLGLGVDERLLE